MICRALVGVCFGCCDADVRQSLDVTFETSSKTYGGVKRAAVKAARMQAPDNWKRLFTRECAVVCMPFGVGYPYMILPKGIGVYDPVLRIVTSKTNGELLQ